MHAFMDVGTDMGKGVSVLQMVDERATHRWGMMMLASIPQRGLVQIPIPTVFERS